MARPVRHTGINGKRLRKLRRREGWSQSDLAEKLGVHRMTLSRWEAGKGDPPLEIASAMSEIFRVEPDWLFESEQTLLERDNPNTAIRDDLLQHYTLAKLQRCTKPALEALDLSLEELSKRVDLPIHRLQELLNGRKPTGFEVQLLRDQLGPDFNPVSTIRNRILAKKPDSEGVTNEGLAVLTLKRLSLLESNLERLESELMHKVGRLETFQLDLLHKVDRLLKLLPQPVEQTS